MLELKSKDVRTVDRFKHWQTYAPGDVARVATDAGDFLGWIICCPFCGLLTKLFPRTAIEDDDGLITIRFQLKHDACGARYWVRKGKVVVA
jgi:hypothetical protein